MCGIAGVVARDGSLPAREVVQRMLTSIGHRGPDGSGIETMERAIFGHRRLSIIDLSGGAQPMLSARSDAMISFNGEIYNFIELREELKLAGNEFATASDTEVLLQSYLRDGVRCLTKLNGQFAFALFDSARQTLLLARDRFGEKPLFYHRRGEVLIFASEVKAILEYFSSTGIQPKLSRSAFLAFHSLNYVPGDSTFVEGVYAVPPGHFVTLEADGKMTIQNFVEPTFPSVADVEGRASASSYDFSAMLSQALLRAVELRLRSDVPVGFFLSGGIDSTVLATCLRQLGASPTAFIADFADAGFSEAQLATRISKSLGFQHQLVRIDSTNHVLTDLIPRLVHHADTPLADSSALPVYLLSQRVAEFTKVALSGDGGDELFGGYLTYRATLLAQQLPSPLRRLLARTSPLWGLLRAGNGKVGLREKVDRFLRNVDLPPSAAHFAWNATFRLAEKMQFIHPDCFDVGGLQETFVRLAAQFALPNRPSLQQLMAADQRGYLPNDILAKVDRMSMAHGLEVRPVFLDPNVAALSQMLPANLLVQGSNQKIILKQLLSKSLPWYPLNAKKQGFSIPVHQWLRGPLKNFVEETLFAKDTADSGLYNMAGLRELWQQHQTRRRNLGFHFWGILVGALWMREYLRNGRSR